MSRNLLIALCLAAAAPAAFADSAQGLTASEAATLYHLPEGDEALPLLWVKALEDPSTHRPFLEGPERYGGIADPADHDGLPIGAASSIPADLQWAGVKMVGITCAACHVGEVRYRGKSMRVLGGPSFFNGAAFGRALTGSLAHTARDPAALMKFVRRLIELKAQDERAVAVSVVHADHQALHGLLAELEADQQKGSLGDQVRAHVDQVVKGQSKPTLSSKLRAAVASFKARAKSAIHKLDPAQRAEQIEALVHASAQTARLLEERIKALTPPKKTGEPPGMEFGPGRADAFGTLLHKFYASQGVGSPSAPASYPEVWDVSRSPWYHYDGDTDAILQRNAGQALALGIVVDPTTAASTMKLRSLNAIESAFWKLKPPAWPAPMLGAINATKKSQGQKLFQQRCASCHVAKVFELMDPAKVGTDLSRLQAAGVQIPDGKGGHQPALLVAMTQLNGLIAAAAKREQITPAELIKMRFGRPPKETWRITNKLRIPSLRGIWATAPYLHNGSVPTLYDLLLPAAQRPRKFLIGGYQFDPVHVGFATTAADPAHFEVDTAAAGNHNSGHEFGGPLSDAERLALVEYLKTL